MGSAGVRFGRNVPLTETFPDTANLMNPNPRTVSLELLTRTTFQPADDPQRAGRRLDPVPGARLVRAQQGHAGPTRTTSRSPTATPGTSARCACRRRRPIRRRCRTRRGRRPTPTRTRTGGTDRRSTAARRPSRRRCASARDGKVQVGDDGRLGCRPDTGLEITGFTENAWVGLSLLHGLFALEHNAICDMLTQAQPDWDDERLFQQARLINAALMAKIHTVEWTPAILPHPVLGRRCAPTGAACAGDLQKVFTRPQRQRAARRHSRLADRSPHGAVLADRGVRRPSTGCTR